MVQVGDAFIYSPNLNIIYPIYVLLSHIQSKMRTFRWESKFEPKSFGSGLIWFKILVRLIPFKIQFNPFSKQSKRKWCVLNVDEFLS